MSSNSLNWYFCMNSLLPETKMNSRVILSFIYSSASIKPPGWGGRSLTDGLVETSIVVLLVDAASASLSLKRRRFRSPKVSKG